MGTRQGQREETPEVRKTEQREEEGETQKTKNQSPSRGLNNG